jgi:predicted RNase H-like nuclease (RuvC/YqgF family)
MSAEHYEGGTPKTLVKLEDGDRIARLQELNRSQTASAAKRIDELQTTITELERELELQHKLVAGLESDLAEIADLKRINLDLHERVTSLEADLAEKDQRIGRLVVELGAARMMQRSDFAERTASELSDARARIAELTEAKNERGRRVDELVAEVEKTRRHWMSECLKANAKVAERDKRIAELEAFIKGPTVFGTTRHD